MLHRMPRFGSIAALMLLNTLLAGCGGSSAETKDGAGIVASAPSDEKGETARRATEVAESEGTPNSVPQKIVIDNFTFNPAKLTISAGTQVTWINHDDVPHTVTSTSKPKLFDSGSMDTDDQYSHVFTAPGTYPYFCAVHPHMTAQIIVK